MDYLERFKALQNRTGMYIQERSFACITSFFIGYQCADSKSLAGFEEWLTFKYDAPNNFVFSAQIEYLYLGEEFGKPLREENEAGLIDYLFKLFFEFDAERKEYGLDSILLKHQEYMKKLLDE